MAGWGGRGRLLPVDTLAAAASSNSSPGIEGVKMGTVGSTDVAVAEVQMWDLYELKYERQYGDSLPPCRGHMLIG